MTERTEYTVANPAPGSALAGALAREALAVKRAQELASAGAIGRMTELQTRLGAVKAALDSEDTPLAELGQLAGEERALLGQVKILQPAYDQAMGALRAASAAVREISEEIAHYRHRAAVAIQQLAALDAEEREALAAIAERRAPLRLELARLVEEPGAPALAPDRDRQQAEGRAYQEQALREAYQRFTAWAAAHAGNWQEKAEEVRRRAAELKIPL